jgi:hypothetical protein
LERSDDARVEERFEDDPITATEIVLMVGAVGLIATLLLFVLAAM